MYDRAGDDDLYDRTEEEELDLVRDNGKACIINGGGMLFMTRRCLGNKALYRGLR